MTSRLHKVISVGIALCVSAALIQQAAPAAAGTVVEQLIAEDLVDRVNAERALRGVRPVQVDPRLALYAADWSAEMARTRSLHHSNPAAVHDPPYSFPEQSFGYGETIIWSVHPANANAGRLHLALMASDTHRMNLLQPRYDVVGVGVACDPDGNLWVTHSFGVWWDLGPATIDNTTVPAAQPVARPESGVGCGAPAPAPAPPGACPEGAVPTAGFIDTSSSHHRLSVDCVVWHGVALGVAPKLYGPERLVTRGQMASFIFRAIERAGVELPVTTFDRFFDLGDSPHREAVNRLAAAGIVSGRSPGRYEPDATVTRGQMAALLVGAAAFVTGVSLPVGTTTFSDVAGTTHSVSIAQAAGAGLVQGTATGTYEPNHPVRRDQMATFVARLLALYAE